MGRLWRRRQSPRCRRAGRGGRSGRDPQALQDRGRTGGQLQRHEGRGERGRQPGDWLNPFRGATLRQPASWP